MEATIARMKDQNECYRTEINRYSRLAEDQKEKLLDKMDREVEMNKLVYHLRIKGSSMVM